jgi:hypothetical protein
MNWRVSEALWMILIIGAGVVAADLIRFVLGFLYGVLVGLQVVISMWWIG